MIIFENMNIEDGMRAELIQQITRKKRCLQHFFQKLNELKAGSSTS